MPKAAVAFTGCKLNRYEIQAISESLETNGFDIVPFEQAADLYVINTCGVTSRAEVSSRQLVRRARKTAPDSKVVVTGCYSQLNADEVESLGADLVVSNLQKGNIGIKAGELFGFEIDSSTDTIDSGFDSSGISGMGGLTRAFVKIQEGCDRKCTYCTIWRSRGPVRSRRVEFIVDEINRLVDNNYQEIVLTGVHIGLYDNGNLDLAGLIETLLTKTDIARIRLSSLYPSEVDGRLIELIKSNRRVCPHIHLSIQSGDDKILRAMGRRYTARDMIELSEKLSSSIPGITLGADIIAGFPGEGEEEYRNTYNLVSECNIHHLHAFSFSPRPNTPAFDMLPKVDDIEIKHRADSLKKQGARLKRAHLESFLGRDLYALIEKRTMPKSGLVTGLTENYLRISANAGDEVKGKIVRIRPYSINGDILLSEILATDINRAENY